MKVKMLIVAAALLAVTSLGFCQGGGLGFFTMGFAVPSRCDLQSAPMPDGVPIYIYQDADGDGPDATDPLAPICGTGTPGFRCFNYNTWPINGVELEGWGLLPGQFYYYEHAAVLENPTLLRYYIRVIYARIVGSDSIRTVWTCNNVATLNTEYQDIDCSDPALWSCTEEVIPMVPPCTPDEFTWFHPPMNWGIMDMSICAEVCVEYGHHLVCVGPLPRDNRLPHAVVQPGCNPANTFCNEPDCPPAQGWPFGPIVNWVWQYREGGWYYCADLVAMQGATDGCICIHLDYIENAEIGEVAIVPMNNAVKISWTTLSETNMAGFRIYRDGDAIASKEAAGLAQGANYEYVDATVENGHSYNYELRSIDMNGAEEVLYTFESVTPSFENALVTEYALHQNYPNPFNPSTKIAFDLVDNNTVTLSIYNATGQLVKTLVNGVQYNKGRHSLSFDASNLTSGLYFYTVKIGNEFTATKKMLLVK